MPKTYTVNDDQKGKFAAAYLLRRMAESGEGIPLLTEGDDEHLTEILEKMMAHDVISIRDQKEYFPTVKGREVLKNFERRYQDFLAHFDIFGAVDLTAGTFAFADYFNYDHLAESGRRDWDAYLNQDNWDDLRVAVADFKAIDPVEIVFMSFLNEGRFDTEREGWQFDLLIGSTWRDIEAICSEAISIDELGYEDEQGMVTGDDVLMDILEQGGRLNAELKERERKAEEEAGAEDELLPGDRVRVDDDRDELYGREGTITLLESDGRVQVEIDEDRPLYRRFTPRQLEVIGHTDGYEDDEPETAVIYERYRDPMFISPVWIAPMYNPYFFW